ncbi:cpg-3 [Pristionchus pacificus]|uniref:Cpg-3 n=1 Tax=Pristionchus pacificus TaxID=54126 RepID=A0A454Y231_PRIPA|nr:cpg-3 [Pristionchus pacificus]|eukprot:PDM71997.1 cpg-3 [Pristionchus pacificus]
MIGHYTLLVVLFTSVYCSPSEEGSGWVFDAAAAAAADPAPLTSDPTVIVKTRDVTKCISNKVCTGDRECGERGSCLGFLSVPGTCNCAACVNLWTCRDDRDCGGLKGACDVMYGTCRCMQALERNGFRLLKATSSFCNVKKCRVDHRDDDCLGLPCHTGRCYCRYSWIDD